MASFDSEKYMALFSFYVRTAFALQDSNSVFP